MAGLVGVGLIVLGAFGSFCFLLPGMPYLQYVDFSILLFSPSSLVLGILLSRVSRTEAIHSSPRDRLTSVLLRTAMYLVVIGCLPLLSLFLYLGISGEIVNEGEGILALSVAVVSILLGAGCALVAGLAKYLSRLREGTPVPVSFVHIVLFNGIILFGGFLLIASVFLATFGLPSTPLGLKMPFLYKAFALSAIGGLAFGLLKWRVVKKRRRTPNQAL